MWSKKQKKKKEEAVAGDAKKPRKELPPAPLLKDVRRGSSQSLPSLETVKITQQVQMDQKPSISIPMPPSPPMKTGILKSLDEHTAKKPSPQPAASQPEMVHLFPQMTNRLADLLRVSKVIAELQQSQPSNHQELLAAQNDQKAILNTLTLQEKEQLAELMKRLSEGPSQSSNINNQSQLEKSN